jgi:hypothetical protein
MGNYSEEFKTEKLTEATHICAKILIPIMKVLEIPNFVETKILVNNEVYKLRIEKIKPKKSLFNRFIDFFKFY